VVLGTPDIDAGSDIGIALYKRTLSYATGAAVFQSWHFGQSAASDGYGWTGQQSGSGFINLAPSILHYNWF
jgi:hypothetical protein